MNEISSKNTTLLREFVDKNCENTSVEYKQKHFQLLLEILDSKNHDELIKYVMKKETSNEDTILHVAMKQNNIEIIEFLLPFFDLKLDFEKWIKFLEINDIENTKAVYIVTEDAESNMKIKNLLNEKLDIAKLIKIFNEEKKNKNNTFLEIL